MKVKRAIFINDKIFVSNNFQTVRDGQRIQLGARFGRLTDVIRLNFFEVAGAAFFSKFYVLVRGKRYEVESRARLTIPLTMVNLVGCKPTTDARAIS